MRVVLGVLLGAVLCGVGAVVLALTIGEMTGVSQFEGAFAMGVVFTLGPLAALGGAVLGGLLGARSARRARQGSATGG
jgi:hypothetical protein